MPSARFEQGDRRHSVFASVPSQKASAKKASLNSQKALSGKIFPDNALFRVECMLLLFVFVHLFYPK